MYIYIHAPAPSLFADYQALNYLVFWTLDAEGSVPLGVFGVSLALKVERAFVGCPKTV